MSIILSNGTRFERAEERIREYCEVEVYRDRNYAGGYDDRQNVTDRITREDLESANNLYAGIKRIDFQKILGNPEVPQRLGALRDEELGTTTEAQWGSIRENAASLVAAFISIGDVDLGGATKILHLKRPRLMPILDSPVVKFLTGNDMDVNRFSEAEALQIGMDCLGTVRTDLIRNRAAFDELQDRLTDLPTRLTAVRLHGILCWTQEKWVNRNDPSAKYGTAVKSLDQSLQVVTTPMQAAEAEKPSTTGEITSIKEFRRVVAQAEGVIVITGSAPPRIHRPLCELVTEDRFQRNVMLGEGKATKYYWRSGLVEARKEFGAVACKRCRP